MKAILLTIVSLIFYGCAIAQGNVLAKDTSCYVIRKLDSKTSVNIDATKVEKFVLYDICLGENSDEENQVTINRNGTTKTVKAKLVKAFKNGLAAQKFASKNKILDSSFVEIATAMPPKKISDCHIIRAVEIPLTKKPNVPSEPKIALLNTCLNDKFPQQRPVVEVVRNRKSEFREFEIIKIFNNKNEAEKYAKENDITDISFLE